MNRVVRSCLRVTMVTAFLFTGSAARGHEAELPTLRLAKLAMHLQNPVSKRRCTGAAPRTVDCGPNSRRVVLGELGVTYDLYLLVADIDPEVGLADAAVAILGVLTVHAYSPDQIWYKPTTSERYLHLIDCNRDTTGVALSIPQTMGETAFAGFGRTALDPYRRFYIVPVDRTTWGKVKRMDVPVPTTSPPRPTRIPAARVPDSRVPDGGRGP